MCNMCDKGRRISIELSTDARDRGGDRDPSRVEKTMKLKNMEGEISNGSDIPDTDSVPKLMLVQEGREERETDSRGILSKLVH